ncbi:hypothetical protein CYMTET_15733 [Cymbomonas tetramitiformis]|uniref:Uncharacterized protein n=1 Tax=Cymbomonas tetramitiformis TaxID=36881 RepID=A0AAE0GDY5_9CHLO|nr:hypothetical protein CYMTET_15733 [Cymbomonas tetramitiformis]
MAEGASEGRGHKGHSSHVMNVRFTADEKRVLSVGGKDRAVLQWRLVSTAGTPVRPPTDGGKNRDRLKGAAKCLSAVKRKELQWVHQKAGGARRRSAAY